LFRTTILLDVCFSAQRSPNPTRSVSPPPQKTCGGLVSGLSGLAPPQRGPRQIGPVWIYPPVKKRVFFLLRGRFLIGNFGERPGLADAKYFLGRGSSFRLGFFPPNIRHSNLKKILWSGQGVPLAGEERGRKEAFFCLSFFLSGFFTPNRSKSGEARGLWGCPVYGKSFFLLFPLPLLFEALDDLFAGSNALSPLSLRFFFLFLTAFGTYLRGHPCKGPGPALPSLFLAHLPTSDEFFLLCLFLFSFSFPKKIFSPFFILGRVWAVFDQWLKALVSCGNQVPFRAVVSKHHGFFFGIYMLPRGLPARHPVFPLEGVFSFFGNWPSFIQQGLGPVPGTYCEMKVLVSPARC